MSVTSSWIDWEVQVPSEEISNDASSTYCIIDANGQLETEGSGTQYLLSEDCADEPIQVGELESGSDGTSEFCSSRYNCGKKNNFHPWESQV